METLVKFSTHKGHSNPLVSIIILVYNAPLLTLQTLITLKKTKDVNYEVIVLDNASHLLTKIILTCLFRFRFIDKLIVSAVNTYFAGGNNIASKYVSLSSKYILLLNSDIKIISNDWLTKLLFIHSYGISSIGVCDVGKLYARCDGYCFLIDKELYYKYQLDENYKWWYAITKLNTQVMKENNTSVNGIVDDSTLIKHYWGGSGKAYKKVLTVLPEKDIEHWFKDCSNKLVIKQ